MVWNDLRRVALGYVIRTQGRDRKADGTLERNCKAMDMRKDSEPDACDSGDVFVNSAMRE